MTPELVLMIGLQASGKTTVVEARYAATHVHVSKDKLARGKNVEARQARWIDEALRAGRNVVVDNTHPSVASRASVMALGRANGARIVGIYMASQMSACRERNARRSGDACVPIVALATTLKKLVRPTLDEGFDELWYGALTQAQPGDGIELRSWEESSSGPQRDAAMSG